MAPRALLVVLALFGASCRAPVEKAEARRSASARLPSASARPPSASAPPSPRSVCALGGGRIASPTHEAWFPRTSQSYCIDPNADQRVFGEKGELPLSDAAELLTLDAERLERLGLEQVVTVAYVEDRDEPGRVTASVLSFATADGATAFYTARLAQAAELGHPAFRAFAAGADAVLGEESALVVRALCVVRLDFTNRSLPPGRGAVVAAPVLTALARGIAERLPGENVLPPAARLLPTRDRVELSVRYDALDLLGFDGVGPGARATYDDGSRRFRLALFVKKDGDSAEDVLSTLRKREGSRVLKRAPYDATRVAEHDPKTGAVTEWVFGHKGVLVGGVSLDAPPRAVPRGAPPEREAAVLRMKRLLDGFRGAGPW